MSEQERLLKIETVAGELLDALEQAEEASEPISTLMLHDVIAECCDRLRKLLDEGQPSG